VTEKAKLRGIEGRKATGPSGGDGRVTEVRKETGLPVASFGPGKSGFFILWSGRSKGDHTPDRRLTESADESRFMQASVQAISSIFLGVPFIYEETQNQPSLY
jgi:hypothetical protein